MSQVKKRFPADTSLERDTFLNNKKIDGELYGLLKSYSFPNQKKETIVAKKDLPTQAVMCQMLGIQSPKTFRAHLNYLLDKGYIEDMGEEYLMPNKEGIFFDIPLETLKFLNDCVKEQIIKVYIYLGQRWKYKPGYTFTLEEIAEHIGINLGNNTRNYEMINNALLCLSNNGLLEYVDYFENQKPRKRLVQFSLEIKGKKCR